MKKRLFLLSGILILLAIVPAQAAPAAWQQELDKIKVTHQKQLGTAQGIEQRLYDPSMRDAEFHTMNDEKEFKASWLCGGKQPVIKVSAANASNGELVITVGYDISGSGQQMSTVTVNAVAGACNAGAIYECNPPGSWSKCKYGLLEFNGGTLSISPNLPSGEPRPALGMSGCFCFSSNCGNTSAQYMEDILSHIGEPLARQIADMKKNLVVSPGEYNAAEKSMTWYSGDVKNCEGDSVATLTKQANKLELDYAGTVAAQGPDSPWMLVTGSLERKTSELTCVQETKGVSEWVTVRRKQPTDFWIGWDTNGGSKQCFWMTQNLACGSAFGEPHSWEGCLTQAEQDRASICSNIWVSSGMLLNIKDVQNAAPQGPLTRMGNIGASCYGAEGSPDYAQYWHMDCVGDRYADKFICHSANKAAGVTVYNEPYDPRKYDGCDEVRPYVDNCSSLASREGCRLIKEVTDGVITVMNGALTTARPQPSCRTIKGAKESITLCEPWKRRVRTYECSDLNGDFTKEQRRVDYVGSNISISGDQYFSSVGDLTFGKNGAAKIGTIDAELQMQKKSAICAPSCAIQKSVPNYELIIPSQQGKLEADGSYHVPDSEYSAVPSGTRTIVDRLECNLTGDVYTCPVPEGWSVRSQCSCADGSEFINVIASLSVVNEMSKDFICSTGKEMGVCGPDEGDTTIYPVACGNFPTIDEKNETGEELQKGTNYWDCSPKLWKGIKVAKQDHKVLLGHEYQCLGGSLNFLEGDLLDLGSVVPQKSWFTPKMDWARRQILDYVAGAEIGLTGNQSCTCAGDAYAIDVCRPNTDGRYLCLTDNNRYDTYGSCKATCTGKATYTDATGLCIWRDKLAVYPTGAFGVEYRLGLNRSSEKKFGEVFFTTSADEILFSAGELAKCEDKSVRDEAAWVDSTQACQHYSGTTTESQFISAARNYQLQSMGIPRDPLVFTASSQNLTGMRGFDSETISLDKNSGFDGVNMYAFIRALPGEIVRSNPMSLDISWAVPLDRPNVCSSAMFWDAPAPGTVTSICNFSYPNGISVRSWTVRGGNSGYYGGTLYADTTTYYQFTVNNYGCPTTQKSYAAQAACQNACSTKKLVCKGSGRQVNSPEECTTIKYQCSSDRKSYSTLQECSGKCDTQSVVLRPCVVNGPDLLFSLSLQEAQTDFGFDAVVVRVSGAAETKIAAQAYANENLILGQCIDRFVTPYIKFDEPGLNTHFEYSLLDAAIYQTAYKSGQLPNENGVLPKVPAVYMGHDKRLQHLKEIQLWDDEVAEDGTITTSPNKDLTPEQIAALSSTQTDPSVSGEGQWSNSAKEQAGMVPRAPMFLEKTVTSAPSSPSKQGRVGTAHLIVDGLTSSVHYYECPYGTVNNTTQCGQKYPFGGVAQTIAGQKCFQYFCDENAMIEPTADQYSGCGLANDGKIK